MNENYIKIRRIVTQAFLRSIKEQNLFCLLKKGKVVQPNQPNSFLKGLDGIHSKIKNNTSFPISNVKYDYPMHFTNLLLMSYIEPLVAEYCLKIKMPKLGESIFNRSCQALYGDEFGRDMEEMSEQHSSHTNIDDERMNRIRTLYNALQNTKTDLPPRLKFLRNISFENFVEHFPEIISLKK